MEENIFGDEVFYDENIVSSTSRPVDAADFALPQFDHADQISHPEPASTPQSMEASNVADLSRIYLSRADRVRAHRAVAESLTERLTTGFGWASVLSAMPYLYPFELENQLLIAAQAPAGRLLAPARDWHENGFSITAEAPRTTVIAATSGGEAVVPLIDVANTSAAGYKPAYARLRPLWDRTYRVADSLGFILAPSMAEAPSVDATEGEIRVPMSTTVGQRTRTVLNGIGMVSALRAGHSIPEALVVRESVGYALARAAGLPVKMDDAMAAVDAWLEHSPMAGEAEQVAATTAATVRQVATAGLVRPVTPYLLARSRI